MSYGDRGNGRFGDQSELRAENRYSKVWALKRHRNISFHFFPSVFLLLLLLLWSVLAYSGRISRFLHRKVTGYFVFFLLLRFYLLVVVFPFLLVLIYPLFFFLICFSFVFFFVVWPKFYRRTASGWGCSEGSQRFRQYQQRHFIFIPCHQVEILSLLQIQYWHQYIIAPPKLIIKNERWRWK